MTFVFTHLLTADVKGACVTDTPYLHLPWRMWISTESHTSSDGCGKWYKHFEEYLEGLMEAEEA